MINIIYLLTDNIDIYHKFLNSIAVNFNSLIEISGAKTITKCCHLLDKITDGHR